MFSIYNSFLIVQLVLLVHFYFKCNEVNKQASKTCLSKIVYVVSLGKTKHKAHVGVGEKLLQLVTCWWCPASDVIFVHNWQMFWGNLGLIKRDGCITFGQRFSSEPKT